MEILTEKICKKCGETKKIELFGLIKTNKDGHKGSCKVCLAKYKKEYVKNNKDKVREKNREYNFKNRDKRRKNKKDYDLKKQEEIKIYTKAYRLKYKARIKMWHKEYNLNNRDKINKRVRNYTPPNNIKISKNIRSRIRSAIIAAGVTKCDSSEKLLGCSIDFFKDYIESKFTKGMTWENRGYYGWHFDHIKPCSSFDLSDPEQQKLCFHYTNQQPLWCTTSIAMKYGEGPEYIGNINKQDKIL